ncbi:hypothetical protein CU097_002361, partial [Rhizopus azygosporus]
MLLLVYGGDSLWPEDIVNTVTDLQKQQEQYRKSNDQSPESTTRFPRLFSFFPISSFKWKNITIDSVNFLAIPGLR